LIPEDQSYELIADGFRVVGGVIVHAVTEGDGITVNRTKSDG